MFLSRTFTSVSSPQRGRLVYMLPPHLNLPYWQEPTWTRSGWEAGVDVLPKIISQHAMLEVRQQDFLCVTFEYMFHCGSPEPLFDNVLSCERVKFQRLVNFKMTGSVFSALGFVFCFGFFAPFRKGCFV